MNRTLKDLWFMFLLTTICTVILVAAEDFYQRKLAADPVIMRRTLELLPELSPWKPGEDVRAAFEQVYEQFTVKGIPGSCIVHKKNPALLIRQEDGAGLWGKVTLLVGYDLEKNHLLGVAVLEHSETPGLGARIEEEGFRNQFRGLYAPHGVKAAKIKFREGEFDGISGATLSSKAVEEIINAAITHLRQARAERSGRPG